MVYHKSLNGLFLGTRQECSPRRSLERIRGGAPIDTQEEHFTQEDDLADQSNDGLQIKQVIHVVATKDFHITFNEFLVFGIHPHRHISPSRQLFHLGH